MTKLITATLLILALAVLSSSVFARDLECHFTDRVIKDIDSITISHDVVLINNKHEIRLERSEINCSGFGRQARFDGDGQGYKLVLKTCTSEAELEGVIIDNIKKEIGDIICL